MPDTLKGRLCLILMLAILSVLPVTPSQAATTLQYNQPVGGTLNAGQQVDYTFGGKAGDKPVIAMNEHSGAIVPYVALYDPQGRLIGEDSNGGPKGNALLKGTVLPADGTYKVQASNKASSGSGSYSLVVTEEKHQVGFEGAMAMGPQDKMNYQLSTPWDHTNVTYHISGGLSQFSAQQIDAVIAQALQGWSNGTPLTFTEVSGRGDININFAYIDGPLNILGQTCLPGNPCAGDVTFDNSENWTLGTPQGSDTISLLGVATHELGHAIGLLHTQDANAIMYPEYSPYILTPQADDIAGAQRLYGQGAGRVSNTTAIPAQPTTVPAPPGQMQVSGQLDNTKFAHFWDFDVVAGDTVTITMHATSGDLDSFLIVIDANNSIIAYDDDSGGGKDAQIRNLRFPQAGTYTAVATRFHQAQGESTGTYTLSIQYGTAFRVPAPGTVTVSHPIAAPYHDELRTDHGMAYDVLRR